MQHIARQIFIRYTPRVSIVAGLGQFGSSVKAVLVEKLEGVQCIEPVKSRVPTYDFYTKKTRRFFSFLVTKVRRQGPQGTARAQP